MVGRIRLFKTFLEDNNLETIFLERVGVKCSSSDFFLKQDSNHYVMNICRWSESKEGIDFWVEKHKIWIETLRGYKHDKLSRTTPESK